MSQTTPEHYTAPHGPRTDAILNALPNPVIMIDALDAICFANVAAEAFFEAGTSVLLRGRLDDLVPFSSPLLTLVRQTRQNDSPINEYSVDVGTPRTGGRRTVDLQVAPVPELPGGILIMFQPRTMAQKIDRQLTHRGAARSVSGRQVASTSRSSCPVTPCQSGGGSPSTCTTCRSISSAIASSSSVNRICDAIRLP